MNLLKETLEILKENNKIQADVWWCVLDEAHFSWKDFKKLADIDYDPGYGGNEIRLSLKVVGQDWWLERGEYDGSEWWEFKTLPKKPIAHRIPIDLKGD